MLLSNHEICNSKKPRIINEQEAIGLLSMISKIPLFGKLIE